MDWINLDKDREQWRDLVNAVKNLLVPQNSRKFLSSYITGSLSRRAQLHGVFQRYLRLECNARTHRHTQGIRLPFVN
jgi:hypothetical protein